MNVAVRDLFLDLLIMTVSLQLFSEADADITLPSCTIIGTTLSAANYSVNVSCTSVVFSNVMVQGSMKLNISIAGMVMANPTEPRVVVSISKMILLRGATLAVDSNGYTSERTGGGPTVSIMIQSLIGHDGYLVFRGTFPAAVSVLISDAQMTASSSAVAPPANFDPNNLESLTKIVMLVNVSLSGNSSFIFANSSFTSTRSGTIPFFLAGESPMRVSNGSTLVHKNCSMMSANGSAFFANVSLLFMIDSSMSIISSNITSTEEYGYDAFRLHRSATFASNSFLTMISCTVLGSGGWNAFFIRDAVFAHCSYLTVNSCTMIAEDGNALRLETATFTNRSYMAVTSCVLSSAAIGGSFRISSSATFSEYSQMDVMLCNMTASRGAAFTLNCSFTNYSTMTVTSCLMNSTALLGAGGGLVMLAASFANFSSMTVSLCSMSSSAFGFGGSLLTVSGSSSWIFFLCNFSSPLAAFGFVGNVAIVERNSLWKFDQCVFGGSIGIAFASSTIRFHDGSKWILTNSDFHVSFNIVSAAVMFSRSLLNLNGIGSMSRSSLVLHGVSAWKLWNCTVSSPSSTILQILDADFSISNGSSWSINDCTGASGGVGGSLMFSTSTLTIQQSSEFKILRSAFAAASSSGLSFAAKSVIKVQHLSVFVIAYGKFQGYSSAISASKDSTIQVDGMSAWVISGMLLVTSGGTKNLLPLQLEGSITVSDVSMFALRKNTLQTSSTSEGDHSCIEFTALTISDRGTVIFTDNDCNVPSDDTPFLSVDGPTARAPVERCNRVNGNVWRPLAAVGISSLPCGRCDKTVDCFWPLTEPALFTRMQCEDGARSCPCIRGCGGQEGLMCLPGAGTMGPDGTTFPSCLLNRLNRPRLQTTMTMTLNKTRTATITRSSSPEQPPPSSYDRLPSFQLLPGRSVTQLCSRRLQ